MGKVAFITGGNGITGTAILQHLVQQTTIAQWSKIILTSRSPVETHLHDPRIVFIALDFSRSPEELSRQMRDVCHDTTHAYFSSYVHKDDFSQLRTANLGLFENFLSALTTVAPTSLENITLQTGGKYYDIHLHPAPIPLQDDLPITNPSLENFYHPQEAYLAAQQKGQRWSYNVVRPQAIIGWTSKPNGMNEALNFALYFLLCRELGIPAPMPTNQAFWEGVEDCASAPLLADLTVFVSTTPRCANEAFNAANGDVIMWKYLWPRLAAYFGVAASSEQVFEKQRPVLGQCQVNFSLADWVRDKRAVWDRLCEKTGTESARKTFDYGSWLYQEWACGRSWSTVLSMDKARSYGWTGHVDNYRAFTEAFESFCSHGLIPSLEQLDLHYPSVTALGDTGVPGITK